MMDSRRDRDHGGRGDVSVAASPGKPWLSVVAILMVWWGSSCPLVAQGTPEDAVEQYLAGLGLVDLQIRQLNEIIDRTPKDRTDRVKRLVDLYIDELVVETDDDQRRARMLREIDMLLKKAPDARTPGLDVMLCVAEYLKAETNAERWFYDPKDEGALQAATKTLRSLIQRLQQHRRTLQVDLDQLDKAMENIGPGKLLRKMDKEYDRKKTVSRKADYFLGFSYYYLGVTSRVGQQEISYRKARDIFREFLLLEKGDKLGDFSYQDLGLNIGIFATAVMALGRCEIHLGDSAEGELCFAYFDDVADARHLEAKVFHGVTLILAKQFTRAVTDLEVVFSRKVLGQSQHVWLCLKMVEAGMAYPKTAGAEKMVHAGLRELAGLGQADVVEALVKKYGINLGQLGGFYFSWIKGRMLLAEAEKKKTKGAYELAAQMLALALRDPAAKQDPAAENTVRNQLAFCKFYLQQYEEAARLFELAGVGLREANDQKGGDATWMAIASYQKLLKTKPRYIAKIISLLKEFKREYPQHPQAEKVDLLVSKIQRESLSRMDAVAKLENIAPGDKEYASARYDICLLLYEQWGRDRSKKDVAATLGKQLAAAVDTYLKVAGNQASEERFKCCLWVVEVSLNAGSENLVAARRYLGLAQGIAKNLPTENTSSKLIAAMYYHGMRVSQKTKETSEADSNARWLINNAQGSNYEVPALIHLCQSLEKEPRKNLEQRRQGYQMYGRLAKHYGKTEESLRNSKNAKIVNSKLAQYAYETGAFAEAADILAIFLRIDAKNRDYLERLGLANFQAGRFDESIEQWRTLLSGLKKGSQEWHQAKYYQIASLAKIDRPKATKVYKQFEVFYPAPPSPWKRKYFELGL